MSIRFLLSISPIWLLPVSLVSQGKIDSTSYPPRHAYRHSLRISAPYDPDQGKTVLQTEPFALDSTLALSVLAALDGRVVTKPASSGVVFTFWSTSPAGRYATDRTVSVVLSGHDTLALGKAWPVPKPKPGYNEVLLQGLSLAQFLAIANASSVTIHLGSSTSALTTEQLNGLRDFASRMAPHPAH
jgi:hypothetical protein